MNRFRPRGVWGFILRRLLLGILVLILVSVLVFLATQALPGDPARAILGRNARIETRIRTTTPSSSRRRMNPHTPLGRNLFTTVLSRRR